MGSLRAFVCLITLVVAAATGSACADEEADEDSVDGASTVAAETSTSADTETSTVEAHPEAMPGSLTEPIKGDPVPDDWISTWTDTASEAEWRIYAADSPECEAITEGRSTCFENGPGPSSSPEDLYSAGAISHAGDTIVLRMTFVPAPGGVACFEDDTYAYRLDGDELKLLLDAAGHCFYEAEEARQASKDGTLPSGVFTVWMRAH